MSTQGQAPALVQDTAPVPARNPQFLVDPSSSLAEGTLGVEHPEELSEPKPQSVPKPLMAARLISLAAFVAVAVLALKVEITLAFVACAFFAGVASVVFWSISWSKLPA